MRRIGFGSVSLRTTKPSGVSATMPYLAERPTGAEVAAGVAAVGARDT
jgi:hypothetical protein